MKLYLDKDADKRKEPAGHQRSNLQGSKRTGLRSFLLFLILSFCFWFLQSMQSEMIRRIHIPIGYVAIDANQGVNERIPDYIALEIQDKGIEHLRYILDEPDTIYLDILSDKHKGEFIGISAKDLKNQLNTRLSSSAKILQQSFLDVRIALYERISKRVPLFMAGHVRTADGYVVTEVEFLPDSITLYGEATALRDVSSISMPWGNDRLKESVVRMLSPNLPKGVYTKLKQVQVSVSVDELTEKSFELPITVLNVPETHRLIPLPSLATVKLTIPRSYYAITTPDSLLVSVDYEQISKNLEERPNQLLIGLSKVPQWVIDTYIHPNHVQYILEQK